MISPADLAAHQSETAALLALVAALEAQAVLDQDDIRNLHVALDSARTIGAAIGIIMATTKVTEEQAFAALKFASQNGNRKLRDVADDVVRVGLVLT